MVADIFYPILTLKITVLVSFIQKKKSGALPPTEHHPGPHGGLTAPPPQYPQLQKKQCAHIFSGLSPGLSSKEKIR